MPVIYLLSLLLNVTAVQQELFTNQIWNEATIYDFLEEDLFFEIIYPEELSYTYRIRQAKDFGSTFTYKYKGVRLVVADPPDMCSTPYNSYEIAGGVALATRGECSFVSKAIKAEAAGALAIIVMDNDTSNDESYIEMVDDNTNRDPSIPAGFLLGRSGYIIMRTLTELHEEAAIINIPINLTSTAFHKLNQPPWILW